MIELRVSETGDSRGNYIASRSVETRLYDIDITGGYVVRPFWSKIIRSYMQLSLFQ